MSVARGLSGALVLLISSFAWSQDVHIGVLGLFHPRHLIVTAPSSAALVVSAGRQSFTVERGSTCSGANIGFREGRLLVQCGANSAQATAISVADREGGPTDFFVTIPGKISRRYHGRLEVRAAPGALIPIVSMDLETAVASVVAAESLPGFPDEALKAQAIAVRSYFVAGGGRHEGFDFCDTTHCQFLRAPPGVETPAYKATLATQGMVIAYQARAVVAMYTRSCSGITHTPAELGLPPAAYPYFAVDCKYCRQHPARWHSRISDKQAAGLRSLDERARLETVRRLGWRVIPSDDFTLRKQGSIVFVDGVGQGHGIGLCQAGARAMADEGADFRQILEHYYPNTTLTKRAASAGLN